MRLSGFKIALVVQLTCFGCYVVASVAAEDALRFDQLVLKGTHNSYASRDCDPMFGGNHCPVMHNAPCEQIDDWGVWAIELDFGFVQLPGYDDTVAFVGHNGWEGCDTWADESWTGPLALYLKRIGETRALQYRPVVIKLDYKTWGIDRYDDPNASGPAVESLLLKTFGADGVFGPGDLGAKPWPTVRELSGKVIAFTCFGYSSRKVFGKAPLPEGGKPGYTNLNQVMLGIQSGSKIIFLDQYQVSWTFDYAVPPNPLFVSSNAPRLHSVRNQYGKDCFYWCGSPPACSDPANQGETFEAYQEGTLRLPISHLTTALEKALPGWTLLIKPGVYEAPDGPINQNVRIESTGGVVRIR
jgi:hypothetical protein